MSGGGFSALTQSILVTVQPQYLDSESDPDDSRFVWAYHVTISNSGSDTIKVMRRTWKITDDRGRTVCVEGAGVVGQQPVLEPGDSFQYTSGTPLETSSGFMSGVYHVVSTVSGETLDVEIPAFSLDSPHGRVH